MKAVLFLGLPVIAVLGGLAYIRLAPVDPARWHVDILAPGYIPPETAAVFCPETGSRFQITGDSAEALLSRMEKQALATPRTRRIAGSPAEGRITWETRSAFWGFPDYTTAAVHAEGGELRLCAIARQRFGRNDIGVNARRLGGWLQGMAGWQEVPTLRWSRPLAG